MSVVFSVDFQLLKCNVLNPSLVMSYVYSRRSLSRSPTYTFLAECTLCRVVQLWTGHMCLASKFPSYLGAFHPFVSRYAIPWTALTLSFRTIYFWRLCSYADRLCGLVVRVSGYRYRGLGFDSRRYQTSWVVVGLERGPLSLVRSIEELLE